MLRAVKKFVLTLLTLLTLKFLTYCQGGLRKDEGGRMKDEAKAPRKLGSLPSRLDIGIIRGGGE